MGRKPQRAWLQEGILGSRSHADKRGKRAGSCIDTWARLFSFDQGVTTVEKPHYRQQTTSDVNTSCLTFYVEASYKEIEKKGFFSAGSEKLKTCGGRLQMLKKTQDFLGFVQSTAIKIRHSDEDSSTQVSLEWVSC